MIGNTYPLQCDISHEQYEQYDISSTLNYITLPWSKLNILNPPPDWNWKCMTFPHFPPGNNCAHFDLSLSISHIIRMPNSWSNILRLDLPFMVNAKVNHWHKPVFLICIELSRKSAKYIDMNKMHKWFVFSFNFRKRQRCRNAPVCVFSCLSLCVSISNDANDILFWQMETLSQKP